MSSTIVEQVLVVGDRVQAVERVRHVDEPALALDLGDRLRQRHPARDLLLDEEADHLALLAVLTSSATITLTPYSVGDLRAASSAPEISLWSVTAIAPRPCSRGGRQQHLDRRRAVVASGRCACAGRRRSAGASRAAGAAAGSPRGVVAARGEPRVERLDLVGDGAPRRRGDGRAARSRSRSASSPSRRVELRARASSRRPARTAGRARPRRAAPRRRQARGDRDGAGRDRPRDQRRAAAPGRPRRATSDVGAAAAARPRSSSPGRDEAHALAQLGAQRRRRRAARAQNDDLPRRARRRRAAARAGTGAAPALLVARRRRSARGASAGRSARSSAGAPGDQLVVAGKKRCMIAAVAA